MESIPYQRYAGNVVARGVYGMPSLAGWRPSRRTVVILGFLGLVLALYAAGWIDLQHGLAFGAGPVAAVQGLEAKKGALLTEFDALRTVAEASPTKDYTDEQLTRRAEIMASVERLDDDIKAENWRRQREATAPADVIEGDGVTAGGAPKLFGRLGEQLQAVYRTAKNPGQPDQRLFAINDHAMKIEASTGASESVGFDGGFAVQSDFIPGILDRIYAGSQVAQYCDSREIGEGQNSVTYNVIDESSRATGSRGGGVQGYWIGEGGTLTASRPKLAQQTIRLGKLACLFYATDELLADATALESWTDAEMQDEMSFLLDDAIIEGPGAGVPFGVLNSAATVSIAKETNQTAATVQVNNIKKMFSAMPSRSLGKAAWYIHNEVWPEIFSLSETIGTGGVPMFIPAGGIVDTPAGTLLGRPIRPIEQASALGTIGDITFADFSQYLLVKKGGVQKAVSMHVQFLTDEMAFRWILRINGRAKRLTALTPFKGSRTTSPFVTLATRS